MKNLTWIGIILGLFLSLEISAQEIQRDETFNDIFSRDCCGMTGADGTYSVLLPDGRTVWIFGDTFLGTVNPDNTREKRRPIFIRNSFAIQEEDTLRTFYQEKDGWESSFVIPPDATKGEKFSEDSLWYWPGDGFVENGKLKVFMSAFWQAEEGGWGFRWMRTDLAVFSLPEVTLEKIEHVPFTEGSSIHFGHAVCDKAEGFTYIYGLGEDKKPYVARAVKGSVMSPWKFYTGKGWSSDVKKAQPMLDIQGSEQFSVFKLNDKFVYLTQIGGFDDNTIVSYTSDVPFEGWQNRQNLYKPKVPGNDKDLFAYNALAHPQFINDDGELLVSYNVNSFNLEDLFEDATIYRPRFIRVPVERILEEAN
ncbi:MAG: DUF5005 domain-containing protein [Bacteroidales bacterium]|nr:DUF5005 domain-containing protein [Bacteroidales bacterium]MCF8332931.1 DUF5005 domain-containing protein [Bacteroidales bacterium]